MIQRLIGQAHVLCNSSSSRGRPILFSLFLFSVMSFLFIWASYSSFVFSPKLFLSYSIIVSEGNIQTSKNSTEVHDQSNNTTSIRTIYCDRSKFAADICFMKGDIRIHSSTKSIHLYSNKSENNVVEKIKPSTRKWDKTLMAKTDELNLIQHTEKNDQHACDVYHNETAVVFSFDGYMGNLFHAFNNGLIPLYITSQHLNRNVVFVVIGYQYWWYNKFSDIISLLSNHPPIDFDSDKRTHCFPESIVGLRIHEELSIDPSLMTNHKSIKDFRDLIDQAYWPKINKEVLTETKEEQKINKKKKPRLVVLSRTGSRAITNEDALVTLAERIGFEVSVVRPVVTLAMSEIYKTLNESQVLLGVHGAGMTHLLFMRPEILLIQIVPLGLERLAKGDYEVPAVKLGLKYTKYSIKPTESSLLGQFSKDDPVIKDPESVSKKGWEFTTLYLSNQTITLDLKRFRKVLVDAYEYSSGLIETM